MRVILHIPLCRRNLGASELAAFDIGTSRRGEGLRAPHRFPVRPNPPLVRVSGPANAKIVFERAMEFKAMLGAPVEIDGLLLQVDDPERFKQAVAAVLTDR
jgi:hypothetical protein